MLHRANVQSHKIFMNINLPTFCCCCPIVVISRTCWALSFRDIRYFLNKIVVNFMWSNLGSFEITSEGTMRKIRYENCQFSIFSISRFFQSLFNVSKETKLDPTSLFPQFMRGPIYGMFWDEKNIFPNLCKL